MTQLAAGAGRHLLTRSGHPALRSLPSTPGANGGDSGQFNTFYWTAILGRSCAFDLEECGKFPGQAPP